MTTQWQRSTGDSDADCTDVPDMTGLEWYDDTAPLDGSGRWYRAVIRSEGADATIAAGQRAALTRYSRIAQSGTATCGLRAVDGALVCWPTVSPLPPGSELVKSIAGRAGKICALREDGVLACDSRLWLANAQRLDSTLPEASSPRVAPCNAVSGQFLRTRRIAHETAPVRRGQPESCLPDQGRSREWSARGERLRVASVAPVMLASRRSGVAQPGSR